MKVILFTADRMRLPRRGSLKDKAGKAGSGVSSSGEAGHVLARPLMAGKAWPVRACPVKSGLVRACPLMAGKASSYFLRWPLSLSFKGGGDIDAVRILE